MPAKRRVLIVDDHRDSVDSLALLLDLMGNETRVAHNGLEALDVAEAFQPHVTLLDLGLPKLSGYDVARRIREQPWGKSMVLIAVSGWGREEDRQKATEAGFDQHFVKPVDFALLEKFLAQVRA